MAPTTGAQLWLAPLCTVKACGGKSGATNGGVHHRFRPRMPATPEQANRRIPQPVPKRRFPWRTMSPPCRRCRRHGRRRRRRAGNPRAEIALRRLLYPADLLPGLPHEAPSPLQLRASRSSLVAAELLGRWQQRLPDLCRKDNVGSSICVSRSRTWPSLASLFRGPLRDLCGSRACCAPGVFGGAWLLGPHPHLQHMSRTLGRIGQMRRDIPDHALSIRFVWHAPMHSPRICGTTGTAKCARRSALGRARTPLCWQSQIEKTLGHRNGGERPCEDKQGPALTHPTAELALDH